MAITEERKECLYSYWLEETEDLETQEWREELTVEEGRLIDSWDRQYAVGFEKLAKALAEAEQKNKEAHRTSEMER